MTKIIEYELMKADIKIDSNVERIFIQIHGQVVGENKERYLKLPLDLEEAYIVALGMLELIHQAKFIKKVEAADREDGFAPRNLR